MPANQQFETIIFDLGGVLIDWNPQYLYRKIFPDEEERTYFLQNVCTPHWNEQQDAGRSIEEANKILIDQYPQFEKEILAFYGRWTEMLGGPIDETVELLKLLNGNGNHRLLALTNWSAETFPIALERYDFLQIFSGILVSGQENMKKPDPRIYQLILDRYHVDPATSVFIDDSQRNIDAAIKEGIDGIVFTSAHQLREALVARSIL
ncbi:MAG: HAD family phosphatase [Bacteroidota bacterium]